ncbi:hypothetical protein Dimus_015964 [Dionaea muscipula]
MRNKNSNQEQNNRLKGELKSEKERLIELADVSLRLRADVVQVTKENQTVEEENEKLKAELEKEKEKGKRSRECIVMLHNDLFDKSLKNERLHSELNDTCQKLTQILEKRNLVEARLPKQVDYMMKEAQREHLESDEFKGMFNGTSALILRNRSRLGVAQVRRMLQEDDPLIPELDKMEIDVKTPFSQEKIPKIEKKPAEWTEAYDVGALTFIEDWGERDKRNVLNAFHV